MATDDSPQKRVEAHYHHRDLESAILESLERAGRDPDSVTPEEFAAIDEFHIGGRSATVEMAREIGITSEMLVLDIGSGLGGASRYLAREFGCKVVGLDLSAEYGKVAIGLAKHQGLSDLVTYRQGSALEIPFPDGIFDLVWTQHTAMNIPDKPLFYREVRRVLKKGGRLALYDILAGPGGDIHYPVPWAREAQINFLISPQRLAEILRETGFETLSWKDLTAEGLSWFRRRKEKAASQQGCPPLGLHLLLGQEFQKMVQNQLVNLEQDRIALIRAVLQLGETK